MREPAAPSPRGRRPPPLTPPGEPGLNHLSQAPEPLVRAILLTLCDDERVKSRALRYFTRLLQFEEAAADAPGPEDLRSPTSGVPAKNARKRRKTGNPRICVQCDAIFVDEDNGPDVCRYHAGIMQLFDVTKIEAGWDVTDDDDTDANRAAFPDAFRWLCCNVEGSRPGCRRGRHEANPDLSLKGRGTGSQESSLERDPLTLDGGGVSEEEDDDSGPAEDNNGIANGSLRHDTFLETGLLRDGRRRGRMGRERKEVAGRGRDVQGGKGTARATCLSRHVIGQPVSREPGFRAHASNRILSR